MDCKLSNYLIFYFRSHNDPEWMIGKSKLEYYVIIIKVIQCRILLKVFPESYVNYCNFLGYLRRIVL